MTKNYQKSKRPLLFKKTDIASMLNVDLTDLRYCLSEEVKQKVDWKVGIQMFRDDQVLLILQDFRRLATVEELKKIIYPMGY